MMEPLAKAVGLDVNHKHQENDYRKVADDILRKSKYNNSNILICWHHGTILDVAAALGVDANKLPRESNWPSARGRAKYMHDGETTS
jgi:hypothetical protein